MSTVESIARPRRNGERRRAPTASIDRKSGSAGMPRPISYAVFCLKKKEHPALHRIRLERTCDPLEHRHSPGLQYVVNRTHPDTALRTIHARLDILSDSDTPPCHPPH